MAKFELERTNASNLCFEGKMLNMASNGWERPDADFEGEPGRRQDLAVYETIDGKFVCQRIRRSQHAGEQGSHEAQVCDDRAAVERFFGTGSLAKSLLTQLRAPQSNHAESVSTEGERMFVSSTSKLMHDFLDVTPTTRREQLS